LLHVDIVGRTQVVIVARAQETEALGHDFEDARSLEDALEVVGN